MKDFFKIKPSISSGLERMHDMNGPAKLKPLLTRWGKKLFGPSLVERSSHLSLETRPFRLRWLVPIIFIGEQSSQARAHHPQVHADLLMDPPLGILALL